MICSLCVTPYHTSVAAGISEEIITEPDDTEEEVQELTTESPATEECIEDNMLSTVESDTISGDDVSETQEQSENDNMPDDTYSTGYIDTGDRVEPYSINENRNGLLRESSLPASYRSPYMSRVKNQNPYETCWSFSVMGAAETYMLKNASETEQDYSEYQLAYFFYHHVDDELGNLSGDSVNINNGKNYLTLGGNNYWTMFALSSWIGVGNESIAQYSSAAPTSCLSSDLAYQDSLYMTDARIISMSSKDDIKKAIQEYGGVVSAVYMYNPGTTYFNATNLALYQNVNTSGNHSIMIVGWDDEYSLTNFNSGHQPSGNGAWLVRNSWGDSVDYFWVSYEDTCISNQDAFAYSFSDTDRFDYNYQYDGSFGANVYSMTNGSTMANTYQVTGAVQEKIEAVSFALYSDNVNYSVQIYKNSPEDNPLGGEPLLSAPITGQTTYSGYYTVDLPEDIYLQYGDSFTAAVTTTMDSDTPVKWFMDKSYSILGVDFVSSTQDNQSYWIVGGRVHDLYEEYGDTGLCPRIKAFTTVVNIENPIDMNGISVSAIEPQEYTGKALTPNPVLKYGQVTLKKNRDYTVTYKNNVNLGTATVTISGLGNFSGSKTITFSIVGRKNPVTVYNGVDYSAVYDYNYYVTKYADIWRAYGTDDVKTLAHFINYGMAEGRQGIAAFDVNSYANKYYDLRKAYKNDMKKYYLHYINYGKKEGRVATGITALQGGSAVYNGVDYSAVFSVSFYAGKYADLKKTFKYDDEAYLKHFINYGMAEGRQGIATFNVTSYAYRYYDLRKVYKNNLKNYYLHYVMYGKKEGRIATGTTMMQGGPVSYGGVNYSPVFNVGYYANKYSDLRRIYGLDDNAYLLHFVNYGMTEGRQASSDFNVTNYRNRYGDLRRAYGTNLKLYYIHYINYGLKENRNGK